MRSHIKWLAALALALPLHGQQTVSGAVSIAGRTGGNDIVYDWYVDQVNGLDSYDGRTAGTAFKTLAAVQGHILAGTKVCLMRGSRWREQLTIPAVYGVTIGSCGGGAEWIIDSSNAVPSWTLDTGNTYQATVVTTALQTNVWVNVWESNAYLNRATSQVNCESSAGTYWPSSDLSGTITLYIHSAKANPNPNTNGAIYEYSAREYGIDAYNSDHLTLLGGVTEKNYGNDGSARLGRFTTAVGTAHLYGGKHNVYFRAGSTLTNLTARYYYYNNVGTAMLIGNEDNPAGEGLTIINPIIDGGVTFAMAFSVGFDAHPNVSGTFGPIVIVNPTIIGSLAAGITSATSISGGSVASTVVKAIAAFGGVTVDGTNVAGGVVDCNSANGRAGTCVVKNVTAGWVVVAGTTVVLTNSTVGYVTSHAGVTNTLLATGNTYTGLVYAYSLDAAIALTSNNNNFAGTVDKVGILAGLNGGNVMTRAQWQALGYDLGSTFH